MMGAVKGPESEDGGREVGEMGRTSFKSEKIL
jgi:hypothetical protein